MTDSLPSQSAAAPSVPSAGEAAPPATPAASDAPHKAPTPAFSPLRDDTDALLPAAEFLRQGPRSNGWTPGRQAGFLTHLADNGIVADAARAVGQSLSGAYAFRRRAQGYAFALGWEAALLIARRIVADQLMSAAIKGEQARWVRDGGVTTYTRLNTKLSLALLDRVSPMESLPEVLAVVGCFDLYLEMIDGGESAENMWAIFFDGNIPRREIEARERVRGGLLLSEESAGFSEDDEEDDEDDEEWFDDNFGGA